VSTSSAHLPGPRGVDVVRTLLALRRDPLAAFQHVADTYGDVVRFPFGRRAFVLVAHADGVRHVLQDNAHRYSKRTRSYRQVATLLGDGLVTSNGERWRRQRRAAQPMFARRQVARLDGMIVRAAEVMIDRWRDLARREEPVDLGAEMVQLTLGVVVQAFIGACTPDQAARLGRAVDTAVNHVSARVEGLFDPGLGWPSRRNRRFKQALRVLDAAVDDFAAAAGSDSLVARLAEASRDEKDAQRLVRDQVMTFLLAGHETTANALTWALYLLATHPDVLRRVEDEVADALGERAPSNADLAALPFLRAVFLESLRLYPPIWLIERRAEEDDEIDGHAIPAGTTLALCPYLTHRHTDYWRCPDVFAPERFLHDGADSLPRFAYFPFGGAARHCIGDHFAMMEALIVLASIVRSFQLRVAPGTSVRPRPGVTLRPSEPILLQLALR
jgi:cytochrome P450